MPETRVRVGHVQLITYPDGQRINWMINGSSLLSMPPDTPFGNLNPKLFWVLSLLAHANMRLEETAAHWQAARAGSLGPAAVEHRFTANEAVFAMRRAADELVTLTSVLEDRVENGTYPSKPRVDSVGAALTLDGSGKAKLWGNHRGLLSSLNDLANAHKHSFVDSNSSVIGQEQPCASALHLPHNDLEKHSVRLYVVALDDLATGYNAFLADELARLADLTESLRRTTAR